MAYANYIAVVEWDAVLRLRAGGQKTLRPLSVGVVSHLTAHWEKREPLGSCLTQILDGGQELSPIFWHPFRAPRVHSPNEVRTLQTSLRKALEALTPAGELACALDQDVASICAAIDSAVNSGAAIVSALEPPADEERGRRVACPFDQPDQLPIPWGNLSALFKELE